MVSETRGDTGKGDFKSYDHPDRNLVINWTDDSRGDGAAIRDAQVNAKILRLILILKEISGRIKGLSLMVIPRFRPVEIFVSILMMMVYILKVTDL